MSELLCRIARDSPHLIIFPTVVGAAQEKRFNVTELSTFSSDNRYSSTSNSALTTCFNSLLDTLSKQASEQVQQVQLMVRELKRITLLWEELWLSQLSPIYSECTKRMANLENDLAKLSADESNTKQMDENKRTVIGEKYRAIIRPVLFVMERLNEAVSVKAETANELAFQERFSSAIQETIHSLKEPLNFSSSSPEAWIKFKQLYTVLQQRSQKRSTSQFKMADISPVLAQMKNTVIPMPGKKSNLLFLLLFLLTIFGIKLQELKLIKTAAEAIQTKIDGFTFDLWTILCKFFQPKPNRKSWHFTAVMVESTLIYLRAWKICIWTNVLCNFCR